MGLFESIKHMIGLCQILGLAPFSLSVEKRKWTQNRRNKIILLCFFCLTVASAGIGIACIVYLLHSGYPTLSVFIYSYTIIIVFVHVFAVFIEHYYMRSLHVRLLNLFGKLECASVYYQGPRLDCVRIKRNIFGIISYWVLGTFGLVLWNNVSFITSENAEDIMFPLAYTLPFILTKLSSVYAMSLITILRYHILALIEHVKALCNEVDDEIDRIAFKNLNMDYRRNLRHEISVNQLEFLKRVYTMIWNASILFKNIFQWSIPISLLNDSSILVFNCYFICAKMVQNPDVDIDDTFYSLVWMALNCINIIFITSTCGRTLEEVTSEFELSDTLANLNYLKFQIYVFLDRNATAFHTEDPCQLL